MDDNYSDLTYSSSIQEGKLSVLEHFWKYSNDNIFIIVLDEDGDFAIEDFNPAQAYNFIFSNDFRGKKLKDLVDETMLIKVEERYNNCIAENKPHSYDESHEIAGKIRHRNTMIIPVLDSKDSKIRIFGIAREMTALVNAKEALATINQGLEQAISERTLELQQSNEKLKKQSQKLEEQAYIDPLTQIGNRRYFFKCAGSLISSSMNDDSPVSLVYLDLDDFKGINDTYGHAAGDAILTEFVNRVKSQIRNTDIFSRFGGEEFVLFIPDTALETAVNKAQKILKSISQNPFVIDKQSVNVTSSIGVAEGYLNDLNLDKLISNADKALYTAKMNGKNRVEAYKL